MKPKKSLLTFIIAGLLALGLLAGTNLQAQAAKHILKYPTVLTFNKPQEVQLGKPYTLSGFVKTDYGAPVPFKDVYFTLNGTKLGQARSDANGYFLKKLSNKFHAGTYNIAATTQPTHFLFGTSGQTSLDVLPADLSIQTVPAIAGVAFYMGGTTFYTDANGVADIKVGTPGKFQLTVMADKYSNPNQRITFARWLDENYQPTETIKIPNDKVLEVGLNVFEQVGETFVDLSGYAVDPTRVEQFTIRSTQGDVFTLKNGAPIWVPASRVSRFKTGLVVTNLKYSVLNLLVDGSNAVNNMQQRFFAHPNDTWQISLILYTLDIRANDGLFGSSVGNSVNLVYPDGHAQGYPLDLNGTAAIHGLARGNYTVQVLNDKGLKQVIPVALSRSQTININVPTNLDLAMVIGLGILVALSLIIFGRLQPLRVRTKNERSGGLPSQQTTLVKQYEVKSYELKTVRKKSDMSPKAGIIKWY